MRWHLFIGFLKKPSKSYGYFLWLLEKKFHAKNSVVAFVLRLKINIEEVWLCPKKEAHAVFGLFLVVKWDISNSNFRYLNALERRLDIAHEINNKLSLLLVPWASGRTMRVPIYRATKLGNLWYKSRFSCTRFTGKMLLLLKNCLWICAYTLQRTVLWSIGCMTVRYNSGFFDTLLNASKS